MRPLILRFKAEAHKTEKLTDPAMLRRLDGTEETSGFGDHFAETEEMDLQLKRAVPTLRFSAELGLFLEVVFETDREPTAEERWQLYLFWKTQVWGGWGMNYEFRLPKGFSKVTVTFDPDPLEPVTDPNAPAMQAIVDGLPIKDPEAVPALGDDELAALERALVWDRPEGEVEAYGLFNAMQHAVSSELQRRQVDRARSKTGIAPITLNNLDAIDNLPDDVF